MSASNDVTAEAGASSLEAEVAAWRSRRALRPEASTGKVRIVRIRKRVILPAGPPKSGALSTAES
ncbi:hypothetical protein ACVW1A_004884 [Bradyrhizobium sp. LB1.3]